LREHEIGHVFGCSSSDAIFLLLLEVSVKLLNFLSSSSETESEEEKQSALNGSSFTVANIEPF
jgi:hypothetical protein